MDKVQATETPIRLMEEAFMRVYHGHKQDRFQVMLTDGTSVEGYVAEADLDPGAPPRKNRLFICQSWPYVGNPHIDPQINVISFNRIQSVQRLPA